MTTPRRHDIDALRVLLFGALILYHVGMLYVADWGWHLKSHYSSEWLQIPMLLINRWRMPLLFVISGFALALLRRRHTGAQMLRSRTQRVLVPLLFGMAVIVPIQPYCQGVVNQLVEPGFGKFLLRYATGGPWPKGAFDGWEHSLTWNHLWYLAYLWTYTLLVVLLLPVLESRAGQVVQRAVTGLRGGALLIVPAIPKMLALMLLSDDFPNTNNLERDWYQHALYFSYFLLGWWLATDAGIWAELRAMRHRSLFFAALNACAYLLIIQRLLPYNVDGWRLFLTRILSGLNPWFWIATVLGWSASLLDRPFRWLPYASEAVLPWYVLHQSLIVAVAYALVPLKIGPMLEPLTVIAATVLGCALIHEYLIRRSRVLRYLFGMKPLTKLRTEASRPGGIMAA